MAIGAKVRSECAPYGVLRWLPVTLRQSWLWALILAPLDQHVHVGRGAGGERVEVVAAFENRDDAALTVFVGDVAKALGDPCEIGLGQVELRQRVVAVG